MPLITRIRTVCGHTFLPHIDASSTVVDLGANDGTFAGEMVRLFGCHVIAVEPSPTMFSLIPTRPEIVRRNAAITSVDGVVTFHVASDPLASSVCHLPSESVAEVIKVEALSLESLLNEANVRSIDLLKVDIEGAEREVLDAVHDDILNSTTQLSIEFHDFCNLMTAADVARTRRRLSGLGFYEIRFAPGNANNLFINLKRWRFPAAERWYVKHVSRNLQAMKRSMLGHRSA